MYSRVKKEAESSYVHNTFYVNVNLEDLIAEC